MDEAREAGSHGSKRRSSQRTAEIEAAFAVIERHIRRLHELDLSDEHPAVVFRPANFESSDR
ncbi:hypothetical protein FP2506_17409 [Fulvimarina pelagi HTCC2506]|uniref:Uncharacterized protein n=2 Tax=Fulvimarina pelagi TaxID=217511 RepID=Q0FY66_9HYPH|nr:hypothetical protein FP2506_17409 [Fulvimarina pelagi HTCC2506]